MGRLPDRPSNSEFWWPPVLGTLEHIDHLLLNRIAGNISRAFYNSSQRVTRGCAWLADTICAPQQCPGPDGTMAPSPYKEYAHWEANVLGTVSYLNNVKALLASFVWVGAHLDRVL
jgi:hypothetical protein